jgi:hypothetical protein
VVSMPANNRPLKPIKAPGMPSTCSSPTTLCYQDDVHKLCECYSDSGKLVQPAHPCFVQQGEAATTLANGIYPDEPICRQEETSAFKVESAKSVGCSTYGA